VRQQRLQVAVLQRQQALEDILQIRPRIVLVEFCRLNLFPAVEGSESSAKLDWAALSTDLQESPNG
jgi:hypothetical protein